MVYFSCLEEYFFSAVLNSLGHFKFWLETIVIIQPQVIISSWQFCVVAVSTWNAHWGTERQVGRVLAFPGSGPPLLWGEVYSETTTLISEVKTRILIREAEKSLSHLRLSFCRCSFPLASTSYHLCYQPVAISAVCWFVCFF